MKTILLIDDCVDYREITANLLMDEGYDVFEAANPMEALPMLEAEEFDLIVCDLHMPFTSGEAQNSFVYSYEVGVKTIQELRDVFPKIPIIAMSNTSTADLRKISQYLHPIPAYTKPTHNQAVLEIIETHLTSPIAAIIQ